MPGDKAFKLLRDAFARADDPYARQLLVDVLGEVVKRPPVTQEAAQLEQATSFLLKASLREKDSAVGWRLAETLGEIAKGLPADQSAKILATHLLKSRMPPTSVGGWR